jgi:Sortase domain
LRNALLARVLIVGVCALLAGGAWLLSGRRGEQTPTLWTTSGERPAAAAPAGALPIIGAGPIRSSATARPGPPVRIRIPAIGVDSRLQRLGLEPDGTLQAPTDWGTAGWYAGGPRPGEAGPAVIAGHVDSTSGPAVFYALRALRIGDAVLVTDRRGTVLRFVVDSIATFPKSRFPTALVYGPQPLPVLRLITCTGAFDAAKHSYVDNLVVSAHLA